MQFYHSDMKTTTTILSIIFSNLCSLQVCCLLFVAWFIVIMKYPGDFKNVISSAENQYLSDKRNVTRFHFRSVFKAFGNIDFQGRYHNFKTLK